VRRRVLLVVGRELGSTRGIVAAGPGSYLDELAAVVGAENVVAGAGATYPLLSREKVVALAPEVVLDATAADDPAAAARDWSALPIPAVAAGRVHMLQAPYFTSPGPRIDEALRDLERLLE
jgi:iron complex transport system substrate-binding protein